MRQLLRSEKVGVKAKVRSRKYLTGEEEMRFTGDKAT